MAGASDQKETAVKKFVGEFKEFVNKGNLIDLAVAFVLGVAFSAVIKALVDNVVMPIIAIPFGKPNFDEALILTINDAQIRFGAFLTVAVTFVATAFVLFLAVKQYNKMKKADEDAAPAGPTETEILAGILEEMKGLRQDQTGNRGTRTN